MSILKTHSFWVVKSYHQTISMTCDLSDGWLWKTPSTQTATVLYRLTFSKFFFFCICQWLFGSHRPYHVKMWNTSIRTCGHVFCSSNPYPTLLRWDGKPKVHSIMNIKKWKCKKTKEKENSECVHTAHPAYIKHIDPNLIWKMLCTHLHTFPCSCSDEFDSEKGVNNVF